MNIINRNGENNSHPPNKRKKTDEKLEVFPSESNLGHGIGKLAATTILNDQLRRSNRRQKVRGEKEYFVDSTMLLRDLKVKVR